MLRSRFGFVIVDDKLKWGHVRQLVLLQWKIPGDCCAGFELACFLLADLSDSWHARNPSVVAC